MSVESEFFGADDLPSGQHDPGEVLEGTSRWTPRRPGLGMLLRAGMRALRRFPGLVLATYLVQVALSAGAAFLMLVLLWGTFGYRPLFRQAMDGDLAALISCFAAEPALFVSLSAIGAAAAMVYGLVSLFLTAGLVAVFLDPPSRRREVARWFGAAGTSSFFPFLRLCLWSAVPYAIVLVAAGGGIAWVGGRLADATSLRDLAAALALGLGPALLLHWPVAAAVDYARIDLVRHPGMSSARALLRGFATIARNPHSLVHTLLYGLLFVGVTALYAWATRGDALSGLAALLAVRQVAGLLRFTAHVALIAGQVELACAATGAPLGRRA